MRRERKRSSFVDVIILVFVILVCFGLTIYGIIYLTGKIFKGEESIDVIAVKETPVSTDPEAGDVMIYTDPANQTNNETIINTATGDKKYPNVVIAENPKQNQPSMPPPAEAIKPAAPTPVVQPKPTTPTSVKPAEPKTSVVKGDYVVQVMAVKSEAAAKQEAAKYKSTCPDVFILKADLGEKGIWYRIRCGISNTKADAEKIKNRLEATFKVTPTIVPNK